LGRAGIDVGRRIIFKFLPPPLYRKLIIMEQQKFAGRERPRTTLFRIKSAGSGYEFYILDR
jgi:hypothetical protein